MPLPGPAPAPTKRRTNKPVHEWVEIPDVPFTGGPPVPKTEKGSVSWPTATRLWWKVVSRMPHCVLWDAADWMFMADTAVIHAAFHLGDVKAATELRQREKVMGTTVDFRRDLRIRYVSAEQEGQPASVTAIEDYRKRLKA